MPWLSPCGLWARLNLVFSRPRGFTPWEKAFSSEDMENKNEKSLPSPFPKRTTEAQSRREESFLKRAVVELNLFSPVKNQLLRLFPSVHRRLVTTGRGPRSDPPKPQLRSRVLSGR